MEADNNLKTTKKKSRKKNKATDCETYLGNDSLQYNRQDLDQEQQVDVNPMQLNTQNIHVHVKYDREKFTGKITGTTYLEFDKDILSNADLYLYFGNDCGMPVYKTSSDNNGNFVIDDLPPGYYVIHASHSEKYRYRSHFIKVLPGNNVHQLIYLK